MLDLKVNTVESGKPSTKAIKADAGLITEALSTVRDRNHGNLKSLVTRFLQLYIDSPVQVFQVIASLEAGVEVSAEGALSVSPPKESEDLGQFQDLF